MTDKPKNLAKLKLMLNGAIAKLIGDGPNSRLSHGETVVAILRREDDSIQVIENQKETR